ncbi:MAG: hypothetical protein WA484_01225 [Solirubrobacteraceae bacterium]
MLVHTPLLGVPIPGNLYLAVPDDRGASVPDAENQFNSLLAIYIVAKEPGTGVILKAPGEVHPDPVTGQLTTTFDELPQAPFTSFTLSFREGQTAPLSTPPSCGVFTALEQFTPWSEPETIIDGSSSFDVTSGVGGGACPSGGVPPFKPQVVAGTLDPTAGAYSPFYTRITRSDGEQEITGFSTLLSPGLLGNLTGIPFCSDAAIEAARTRSGTQETQEPSCPAASKLGHTLVGAGVGGTLVYAPGSVYLAGPYHGSALSVVAITSATVGPFDLGTVVVRFALRIDPHTSQADIDAKGSDPIPHIIDGIPAHVRDIRVYIDRPAFTLNPTNCNPMALAMTVTGSGANFASSSDDVPVNVTDPFQVANCSALGFKPQLKASTSGHTSRVTGASLTVKLTYPTGPQANIHSVKVDLPKQLPARLTTLQKACPDYVFNNNPAGCPPASVVGSAHATTPILPVALNGPAYFVSHGGAAFPELVIVLQGYGITVYLQGATFISKAGITSSTFKSIPDVPVGSFELTLPQGHYSALAANGNLCNTTLRMPTAYTAQNGVSIHTTTPINVTGCAKHKKAKKTSHHKKSKQKKKK